MRCDALHPRGTRIAPLPLHYKFGLERARGGGARVRMLATACADAAAAPLRISWAAHSTCPLLQESDGIQVATNRLLDAADAMAADGLVTAGYR